MATANAEASGAPAPKGKKKLIIIIAAVLLLVLVGGGAAVFIAKKNAAAAAAAAEDEDGEAAAGEGDEEAEAASAKKKDKDAKKHPPIFIPLEAFVVNLADKDTERYAQVGVTLEVDEAKVAEEIKLYMPAIRNGILMVLSHKTAGELLDRPGKEQLAREIMREAALPLGVDLSANGGSKKKKKAVESPVKNVHFSNFIIQ
jgi:flagellar protein FliL